MPISMSWKYTEINVEDKGEVEDHLWKYIVLQDGTERDGTSGTRYADQ